uniref:Uncharacterized protein n=1 Tax=Ditylenchus dipsaci TaxID=166011 RepID=A0A915CR91_9BILA
MSFICVFVLFLIFVNLTEFPFLTFATATLPENSGHNAFDGPKKETASEALLGLMDTYYAKPKEAQDYEKIEKEYKMVLDGVFNELSHSKLPSFSQLSKLKKKREEVQEPVPVLVSSLVKFSNAPVISGSSGCSSKSNQKESLQLKSQVSKIQVVSQAPALYQSNRDFLQ